MIAVFICIPLVALIALSLNVSSHWSHRSSEQLRVDAAVISLCHHRKNYLQDRVLKLNQVIGGLQMGIDSLAAICLAALAALNPAACEQVKAQARILSLQGRSLEKLQNFARTAYPAARHLHEVKVQKENNLLNTGIFQWSGDSRLQGILGLEDGLKREEISAYRRGIEEGIFRGITYPRKLEVTETFEELHQLSASFFPQRALTGIHENRDRRLHGLVTFDHQSRPAFGKGRYVSSSRSSCRITQDLHVERGL